MQKQAYDLLKRLKSGTEEETNGRHIVQAEAKLALSGLTRPKIIDIGAGKGQDILAIRDALVGEGVDSETYAIENYRNSVIHLQNYNVRVVSVDIEKERLPFADEFFDLVVCNQVLEHTKEIFYIVSELTRILKVGGILIVGVPNLASLHNRLALLFGNQPPAIHIIGPHVRGFAPNEMKSFLEAGGVLKIQRTRGANFYPFRKRTARFISRFFPKLSVSSFYIAKKESNRSFIEILDGPYATELCDTPYFRGLPNLQVHELKS